MESSLRSKLKLNAKYWTLYIRHDNDNDYRVQGISLVDRSYIVELSHSGTIPILASKFVGLWVVTKN